MPSFVLSSCKAKLFGSALLSSITKNARTQQANAAMHLTNKNINTFFLKVASSGGTPDNPPLIELRTNIVERAAIGNIMAILKYAIPLYIFRLVQIFIDFQSTKKWGKKLCKNKSNEKWKLTYLLFYIE
jgi:hypothetical protein